MGLRLEGGLAIAFTDMGKRHSWLCGIVLAAPLLASCGERASQRRSEDTLTMLVGSYAPADEEGVRMFQLDQETGDCKEVCGLKGISNPSFLVITDDGKRAYAVGENSEEKATAHLIRLNQQAGTLTLADTKAVHGADPCHLAIMPDSMHLVTANYSGGSITIFPLKADGTMGEGDVIHFTGCGPDTTRQEQAHLHCVYPSPDGKWLMADDLGSDCIHTFPLAPRTRLGIDTSAAQNACMAPGSGPRHAVFDHEGKHLYLLNELQGDVVVCNYANGRLAQVQSIQADSVGARGSADIHLSPDGKYLYASNRLKADGIAIFKVDTHTGLLTRAGYQDTGAHPRNFAITPNGKYLLVACRDANCIEIYQRDADTGMLTDTGKRIQMPRPVVIQFAR